MKKTVLFILIFLAIGSACFYGIAKAVNRPDTILSESDVSIMIQQKYGGTIENASFSQKDDEPIYRITLLKNDIPYHITVNGENGEVQSLIKQKVEKQTSTQTKNNIEEEQKKSEQPPVSPTSDEPLISMEQARDIALQKVKGTFSSVEIEEEEGQTFYEVEIDHSKTREAKVMINAYSGHVDSITYENDDD
ncbi:PepSY domain-containing protein [Priestia megaterium]|uniref:PepSY domain-containing protein n=1 Tax=Priestia megaterium TaxID=1404 RepID=UPI001F143C7F|nr:PepSY domain-containing protein [Priestia megaterium]UMZ33458.1 PepSY domain-containing protein [Priestia megaterium]